MRYSILLSAVLAFGLTPSIFACDECEKHAHDQHHDVTWSDGQHVSHETTVSREGLCNDCTYRADGCSDFVRVDTTTKPTAVYYNNHVAETNGCVRCGEVSHCSECDACDSRSFEVRYEGSNDEDRYFWR
ncbi:MAG TPA: hypothetical protein VEJ63_04635 [Planctomycetota bacterium]|nr:hypothetical protein [Planctomycetota bacterium]